MKKFHSITCLLLCLLLLWGCSADLDGGEETTQPVTDEVTQSTVPGTTAPETTAPTEPEPTEPEPTLPQAAVTEYENVRFENYVSVIPVDGTRVAVASGEYAEDGTENRSLWILDLCSGTLSEPLPMSVDQYLSGQPILNNRILVEDSGNDQYLVLDDTLQTVQTIPVPELYGYFTADLSAYYYVEGDSLTVYDTAKEESWPVTFAEDLHISFLHWYDSEKNILLCAVYVNPFSYDVCNAAIDMSTGEILILSGLTGYQQFNADGVVTEEYNYDTGLLDLYFCTYGSDTYRVIPGEVFQDVNSYTWTVAGSNYLLMSSYDEEIMESSTTFFRYGDELSASRTLVGEVNGYLDSALTMPDGSLLCTYVDDASYYRVLLLRPEEFTFEPVSRSSISDRTLVDPELKDQYARILEGPELSPELADVRAQADAIEEEFDITILLSNQCTRAAEGCEFPMVTTDQVEWMDEAWYICDALSILRRTLELYPEGYFRQFRWEGSANGVLVLLVEDIQSANNAIGVSYGMSNWYPIAVDITSYDLMSTYCHELWHATENFISDHDYDIFNDGSWEEMNPAGFGYSYDTTLEYIYETEWTYYDGWFYSNSYFIDSYARTNAKEDRARLMEYIMAYEEEARSLMEAPALYEKAGYICRAVRQVFDTAGWENVWWERFHEDMDR